MSDADALLAAAAVVRENAHAPYSRFKVGAALRADDGRVYAGANVENASYPEGICAETAAIAAMVAGGGKRIAEFALVTEGPAPASPCGGCRQRLAEFAGAATPVHLATTAGVRHSTTLGELLPLAFTLKR